MIPWEIPYLQAFPEEEWEEMSPNDRRFVRDYYLCERDEADVMDYCFYETHYQMYRMNQEYKLDERPNIAVAK